MERNSRGAAAFVEACALGATFMLITGCGGKSFAPATAPAAPSVAQKSLGDTTVETTGNDALLYASGGFGVNVYTYPGGTFVSNPVDQEVGTLCSDQEGDVYVTEFAGVFEFAHGATTPTREIKDKDADTGCAVDPGSGDLAVSSKSSIAIFPHGNGKPTYYPAYHGLAFGSPGYDDKGNLFVEAAPETSSSTTLLELPAGGKRFRLVLMQQTINALSGVQWDGKYLAVGDTEYAYPSIAGIYRVKIEGTRGTVVSSLSLSGSCGTAYLLQFWIEKSTVVGANGYCGTIDFWNYPGGGSPTKSISSTGALGVTISKVRRSDDRQ